MSEREVIQVKIRKKEHEIQALEEKLKTARVYLQALQDISKVFSKDQIPTTESILREGSAVAQTRELILKTGHPIHINDILDGLGRGLTRESRASLTSSIAAYVRRGEIFTRSAPNTFGLLELGHETSSDSEPLSEPPDEFGST